MGTRLLTGMVVAGTLLVAGCGSGSDEQGREAVAAPETVKVECFWTMRSGDEPVLWERELPVGDADARTKAEQDCTAERSSATLRDVPS